MILYQLKCSCGKIVERKADMALPTVTERVAVLKKKLCPNCGPSGKIKLWGQRFRKDWGSKTKNKRKK